MREEISVTQLLSEMPPSRRFQPRLVKYGLPCARCKAYYASALPACPVCQCGERVSPTLTAVVPELGRGVTQCISTKM